MKMYTFRSQVHSNLDHKKRVHDNLEKGNLVCDNVYHMKTNVS